MITSIVVSQEIFAIESFKILFEASSQACSAIVTTIWRPGLRDSYEVHYCSRPLSQLLHCPQLKSQFEHAYFDLKCLSLKI